MTAREMFADLDYKLVINDEEHIIYVYIDNSDLDICFQKKYKCVSGVPTYDYFLDVELLKAVTKQFEELGLKVATIPSQYTAIGNIVAANDNGAIVSPFLSEDACNIIEETLDVDVDSRSISGSDIIGSLIKVTNNGFLITKNATSSEINLARKVFGVEGDIGTVGKGISLVGACSIANSNGAIVAKGSTGPEMARVEEALGFLDDNF